MNVNAKRERQRKIKVFKQDSTKVKWFGRFISIGSILLSTWSNKIFESSPHEWFDITGRMDILLLGFALVLSLINMYIKITLWFIDVYIGKLGKVKMMMTVGGILLPFIFLVHSLVTKHELYIVPLIAVTAVHFYAHYEPKLSSANKVLSR